MFVIIVGGGNTGSYLAGLLLEGGHKVRIIESRPQLLEKLKHELPTDVIVAGDGSSPDVLDGAGIATAQVLAAVTGDDETNLVITSLARFEFGVPRIIGRVNNPKNVWLFNSDMGVDVELNQADILGHLVAEEMSLGDMMTLLKVRRGEYSLIEEKVHPRSQVANRALRDVALPEECVIVAIIRHSQMIIPRGDVVFEPADEVLALVHSRSLAGINALLGPSDPLRGGR